MINIINHGSIHRKMYRYNILINAIVRYIDVLINSARVNIDSPVDAVLRSERVHFIFEFLIHLRVFACACAVQFDEKSSHFWWLFFSRKKMDSPKRLAYSLSWRHKHHLSLKPIGGGWLIGDESSAMDQKRWPSHPVESQSADVIQLPENTSHQLSLKSIGGLLIDEPSAAHQKR